MRLASGIACSGRSGESDAGAAEGARSIEICGQYAAEIFRYANNLVVAATRSHVAAHSPGRGRRPVTAVSALCDPGREEEEEQGLERMENVGAFWSLWIQDETARNGLQ